MGFGQVGNGVLTGRLELLRKEMETKLAMLENQLEAERRRNKLDFSNLDDKIRSEYAKRLVVKETIRSFLISCKYTVKKD
jgi:hypothetical protein